MASEETRVNATKTLVKNMYVNSGKTLVKIMRVNNGKNIVHRASYDVTYNATTYITVSEASPRIGKHGLPLTYTLLADHENRMVSVTSTWGAGILTQIDPPSAEWTYVTPNITSNGSITITEASDYVDVTSHPSNQTIYEGQVATFSITAVGDQTLSYQWEYSPNGGTNWYNTGVNSSNLSVSTTNTSLSGRLYRCTATSGNASETSNSATLTVNAVTMSFTTEPTTIDEGQTKSWTVYAPNSAGVYWNIDYNSSSSSADFVSYQGYQVTSGGSATFSITASADGFSEGSETFYVRAYVDSGRTNLKDTSLQCTIADTSTSVSPNIVLTSVSSIVLGFGSTTAYAGIKLLPTGQLQKAEGTSSTFSNINTTPSQWLTDIATGNGDDYSITVTVSGSTGSGTGAVTNRRMTSGNDWYYLISVNEGGSQKDTTITITVKDYPSGTVRISSHQITLTAWVDSGGI